MINEPIRSFSGQYEFLSNFYPSPIRWNGEEYPTVEHAYQAGKTIDPTERRKIRLVPRAATAKRLGGQATLRPGWNDMRVAHMEVLLWEKFEIPEMRYRLLSTGDAELIEGNDWHDMFWGQCVCDHHAPQDGRNMLGELLMGIRSVLRTTQDGGRSGSAS